MQKCKKCKKEIPDGSKYCPWCGKKQAPTPRKTIKRENGTGSIYKRTDSRTRPYVAVTPAQKGKKPEIIGHYATAQEAKDALYDFRRYPTDRPNITLKELYEEWKPIGLKNKSKQLADSYNAAFNKLSPLHSTKFREIGYGPVQGIVEFLQKERPKLDKAGKPVMKDDRPVMLKPASFSALHDIKVLMGLLCKYAMKNNIIHENWAELLDLPKDESSVKDCFNELEQKKIENAAFGLNGVAKIPFADCILFLNYTGLRITEFCRLNKFSIHRQGKSCALYGGIKTEAGKNKIVPVHHKVQPILEEWNAKNGQTVFCRPNGTPYTANYFRSKCFYPALKAIGVRRLTPHACRRTCATMMSKAGVQEEDFIAIMGHADFQVDIDNYIFQTAEKLRPAVEKMV
jgi:site-specific recombinase XerD